MSELKIVLKADTDSAASNHFKEKNQFKKVYESDSA